MRVNIISIDNKHSLTDDCNMVCETLKKLYSRKRKIQFEFAAFHKNVAKVADVNIYLGIINNSFFPINPLVSSVKGKCNVIISDSISNSCNPQKLRSLSLSFNFKIVSDMS